MELTQRRIEAIELDLQSANGEGLYGLYLDEVYGDVEICGMTYNAGDALKEVDPTAYRCGMNDYLDGLCSDNTLIEINGEYYSYSDVESYLENDYPTVEYLDRKTA